jgi:anti-sigma factor RsiW
VHHAPASLDRQRRRTSLRALAAAAAVFVALAGGYFVGQRGEGAPSEAPPATRVADAPAAWQEVLPGRTR